jgi:hypothetical protein
MVLPMRAITGPVAAAIAFAACAPSQPSLRSQRPDEAGDAPSAPPDKKAFKNVPPHYIDSLLIHGPTPHLPNRICTRPVNGEITGVYKMCVNSDGTVASVTPVISIPCADETMIATLQTWQLKPSPTGLCTLLRYVYLLR